MTHPFVHTAGRFNYRLNDLVRFSDWYVVIRGNVFDIADITGKMNKLAHLEEVKVLGTVTTHNLLDF